MQTAAQKEHQWLNQLIGEWVSETEYSMEPNQPPSKLSGTEMVRSIGGLWIVAEGQCEMPENDTGQTIMTLGYDPQNQRYVGTFIGSMMTHLWLYSGSLDAAAQVLTLEAEGPNLNQNAMAKYKDRIEFVSADHRIMTSQILGDDGNWLQFMTSHYRRRSPSIN
ncbi:MAG: DUF1579 domain-containing protein [Pegethrix bostrychoides GSE-TBD4-15B]|jgi:hypothetical protein|uniref:DUF1579 domain-containing protein n=1 Tax=Pegethrix bostrychoides GSE-TBD4-15B TaxID=2839662 RepID=A0A951P9K0_9CYAN|nr:DUF1579 domain-containing protein [Pegethrix bostrychoides GSE-TBD4-15B]